MDYDFYDEFLLNDFYPWTLTDFTLPSPVPVSAPFETSTREPRDRNALESHCWMCPFLHCGLGLLPDI